MKRIGFLVGFLFFLNDGFAKTPIVVPQPTSCITGSFNATGTSSWKTISLKLTNNCDQTVDFQNSTITFSNLSNLNTTFWGNFAPLSYPINTLQITSQPQSGGAFLSSLSLQFPTYPGANSKLPKGSSFTIIYGAPTADYLANSTLVYLNSPVSTGNINLINTTAKPANVSQTYALVNLTLNGQTVSTVQVPWSGQQLIPGLGVGTYTISPTNVSSSTGIIYQGVANPANLTVSAGTTVSSTITYTASQTTGNINRALA